MISFVSSVMKNIVVFAFTIWPQFRFLLDLDLELICYIAFESASSACCSLKSFAIISSRLQGYLVHFSAQAQKIKKKNTLKKFLYFFKNFFLTFCEMELFSPILILYNPKLKIFLEKISKLKKLLYFRKELAKPEKQKFLIFL